MRRVLERLRGTNAYLLPFLLFGTLPERPAAYALAPLLTLAAAGALVASLFGGGAFLVLVGICAVNIVVRLAYRRRIASFLHALPPLRVLVRAGLALSGPDGGLPDGPRSRLSAIAEPLRPLLRTTSWLVFETEQADGMSRLLYEYANLVFLLDVDAFLFSLELLRRRRPAIRELFEALGEIDGALSVGAFRESLPAWCRPRFTPPGSPLRVQGAFHPLLDAPVANDLAVEGRGVLVTGSNMSGKTTFIKTIGLDALLGATLFTCPARSWEAPQFDVVSAIGRSESLADGTSYYLGEVRRVLALVRAAEEEHAAPLPPRRALPRDEHRRADRGREGRPRDTSRAARTSPSSRRTTSSSSRSLPGATRPATSASPSRTAGSRSTTGSAPGPRRRATRSRSSRAPGSPRTSSRTP